MLSLSLDELGPRSRAAIGRGPARARCLEVVASFLDSDPDRVDGFSDEGLGFVAALAGPCDFRHLPPLRRCFRHVGAGIARAWGRDAMWPDGVWGHLEADGLGFAAGLLRTRSALRRAPDAPASRWADHGIGRSLWFTAAGSPSIARLVESIDGDRRPAIWSGLGLASTFTGGADTGRLSLAGGDAFRSGAHFGEALRAALDGRSEGIRFDEDAFHARLAATLGDDVGNRRTRST